MFYFDENTFEDVDLNDELSYSAQNMPSWLSFDASNRCFYGIPSVSDTSTAEITLIAIDNSGESVSTTFDLSVEYNAPRLISFPTNQVLEDEQFNYQILFTDPLGVENTNINISSNADWVNIDTSNNTIFGTPENDDVGFCNLTISLSNSLHTVNYNFEVQVINTNDAPYATDTLPDYEIDAGSFLNIFVPNGIFADDDIDDELSYSTSDLPEWLSFNSNNLTFWGQPSISDTGIYPISLIATDLSGASDTIGFNVIVNNRTIDKLSDIVDNSFNIYPNPTTDIINIEFYSEGSKQIYILDESGKLVYSDFTNQKFKSYDLSFTEKGIYFIYIKKNNETFVKKIIVY